MESVNVTAAELENWLHHQKKKAAWLAATLGVTKPTVGRWLKGQDIPDPMQHLLRLLIRGEIPPGFSKPRDPAVLPFTREEWRVIEICSVREGFPDATSWVVAKIRAYLKMANFDPFTVLPAAVPPAEPRTVYPDARAERLRSSLNEEPAAIPTVKAK